METQEIQRSSPGMVRDADGLVYRVLDQQVHFLQGRYQYD